MQGVIKTPNFPEFYKPNTYCEYSINVGPDPNRKIVMKFKSFATEECGPEDSDDICDWLKVYDGNSTVNKLIGRFSGANTWGIHNGWPSVVQTGDTALLQFRSNSNKQYHGFRMEYHTKFQGLFCS